MTNFRRLWLRARTRAHRVYVYAREHWTALLLGFLTISSTGYGISRWESSQTFNGLTMYCISSKIIQYPLDKPPWTRGEFDISIGFKNPNWFPVNVAWSATPLMNNSNFFSGFLHDDIPGLSSHLTTMRFAFIPPILANYTLNGVVSYERYSILGDVFADPRVFFISSDQAIHLPSNETRAVDLIANRVPGILGSIFIQHSNLLQIQEIVCNPNEMP